MFGWSRKTKERRLEPESRWTVELRDGLICVTDDTGQVKSVLADQLAGVIIETNDSGPWGADLWWLMFGPNDEMACAFPQGATGEAAVIDYLSALPGFDHGEMINAMASTANAFFPVYRRMA